MLKTPDPRLKGEGVPVMGGGGVWMQACVLDSRQFMEVISEMIDT